MNSQEFVEAIKRKGETNVKSVISILQNPPGRSPAEKDKILSKWYNECNEEQKVKILEIVRGAIDMNIFSLLCVLDGVSAIENTYDKGTLLLYYEKDGERVLLNDNDQNYLHDLL